jgi:hypothetical protein
MHAMHMYIHIIHQQYHVHIIHQQYHVRTISSDSWMVANTCCGLLRAVRCILIQNKASVIKPAADEN